MQEWSKVRENVFITTLFMGKLSFCQTFSMITVALGAIAVSLLKFLLVTLPSNSFSITLLVNINILLFELLYFLSDLLSLSEPDQKGFFSI